SSIVGGYQLIDKDNTVFVFDAEGYVLTETDAKGRVTTYTYIVYDDEKLISEIERPTYTVNFNYTDGKLVGASNTLGDWVSLGYSGELLSSVTQNDPDGAGPLLAPET